MPILTSLLWPLFQASVISLAEKQKPTLFALAGGQSLKFSTKTHNALASWKSNTLASSFILDSGCTRHMFHSQELFESITPLTPGEIDKVSGIGGHSLKLQGKGTVVLPTRKSTGEIGWIRIPDVLYCPELGTNLLSCLSLLRSNIYVGLDLSGATLVIKGDKPVVFTCSITQELFCLDVDVRILVKRANRPGHNNKTYDLEQTRRAYSAQVKQVFDKLDTLEQCTWYRSLAAFTTREAHAIWHERLGHLGEANIVKLKNMSEGLDLNLPPPLCACEACLEGRMAKAPHKGHIEPGWYPDELIHMDTVGPLKKAYDGSVSLYTS